MKTRPSLTDNEREHRHEPMRMCIITGIFPPDIGGPATYVPLMAAALTQHGHAVSTLR